MKLIKVGDLFEIPLSDGRRAFGQYLVQSKIGPIIQIFSILTNDCIDLKTITSSKTLFPPVITGLFAAIRDKMWKVIGNQPVSGFVHPKFISTNWDEHGNALFWHLWDGERYTPIGKELSNQYKTLEFLVVWPPQMVNQRIETGNIPFPYGEIIKNNKFTPLS